MKPEEIRHKGPDRFFHWLMATLVIILLGTSFFPILGIHFNWVPTHWISGVLLTLAILFHLYRVIFVHGLSSMMPKKREMFFWKNQATSNDQKYDINQKLYHWAISLILLILVITGCLMLAKIDTPFWQRDPSILSDWNWGIVYTLHGAVSMLLIFFFILHIYFTLLPEHRTLLISMAYGKTKTKLDNKGKSSP